LLSAAGQGVSEEIVTADGLAAIVASLGAKP